jgi:hypothetical protein
MVILVETLASLNGKGLPSVWQCTHPTYFSSTVILSKSVTSKQVDWYRSSKGMISVVFGMAELLTEVRLSFRQETIQYYRNPGCMR